MIRQRKERERERGGTEITIEGLSASQKVQEGAWWSVSERERERERERKREGGTHNSLWNLFRNLMGRQTGWQ
jgi:hypothetical protein